MDLMGAIYLIGYLSTITILGEMPLFVFSIYTYPKHPFTKRARTPRERFIAMYVIGPARLFFGLLLAVTYVDYANYYPRPSRMLPQVISLIAIELVAAIITLYVGIVIPVREMRREAEERAKHMVSTRYEHRKWYFKYKQEAQEERSFLNTCRKRSMP